MKRIWLDCDPGHDDAMAIILAAHGSEKIQLLGISTVYGNQTALNTTQNAVKVHYAAGLSKDIKVVKGATKPLIRKERTCAEIHGSSGLDTINDRTNSFFPTMSELIDTAREQQILFPESKKAINVIAEQIQKTYAETKEKIIFVCTGAFTNLSLLFSVYPEIKDSIEKIISMSGAMGLGNTGPSTEWNVELDPEAAKIVFECGLPIVQIPLEVTHTVLITPTIIDKLKTNQSNFYDWIIDLFAFFTSSYTEFFGFANPPLHDPLTIAYLIDPTLFKTRMMNVEIETSSTLTSGQTVCDFYGLTGRPKNVEMCVEVNVEKFWELQLQSLERANALSPLNKQ